jgi:glycosyltransferase involved in cell wall biosynthesis
MAIALAAAAKDCRVRPVSGEHRGYVRWLNDGLKMAHGELIARMDADDIALPQRLARQVAFLDAQPQCCVVGSRAIRIDADGSPINLCHVPEDHEQIDGQHMRSQSGAMLHPSVMMRRSALVQLGGYRPEFEPAEDYDLFLRLAEIGQVANLPEVLLHYRVHDRCVTFSRAAQQARCTRGALEDAWIRRGRTGPLPPSHHDSRQPSHDELLWSWTRQAFAASNFRTARKHALRLVRRRPIELRRWALFAGACLGPLAVLVRRVCSYRVGPYART